MHAMKKSSARIALGIGISYAAINYQTAILAETAHDPGVRQVESAEPAPIPYLNVGELALWSKGKEEFNTIDTVKDGLGPTLNLNSCQSCHSYPQSGGSSPPDNLQYVFWRDVLQKAQPMDPTKKNILPTFISKDGPTREVRYKQNPDGTADGGVHDLFTIAGLPDADKCEPTQSDTQHQYDTGNAIFRIPTPTFGAGLIEQIPDQNIVDNVAAMRQLGSAYGIKGKLNIVNAGHTIALRVNRNGNDGTIARFGWKAQNKSLLVFSGEAYNVEMGVTNELFQTERDESPDCQKLIGTPNDTTDPNAKDLDVLGDIEKFAAFMRFLAPPMPSNIEPGGTFSIASGRKLFDDVGCALCHTPTLRTGLSKVAALSNKEVNLFSDLALHDLGSGLADGISQGQATGSEFRTAPLWGLGQRVFLLHDGRATDLVKAIYEHQSPSSEANISVMKFDGLSDSAKQDLLNFLRSL
jgi:CxxC motif-containing protein (DUF1111 family)